MPLPPPDIGRIVKEARKNQGLTLERLAARSGVSRSMLSAIERGMVNPTFSVVWSLTQALGLDLAHVENTPSHEEPIEHLHHYSTPVRHSADGLCSLAMLSPRRPQLPVEWHHLRLEVGGLLDSQAHAPGTMEHVTCLEGQLLIQIGQRQVPVMAGDTVRYRADRPHAIRNAGDGSASAILLVALPPHFQQR